MFASAIALCLREGTTTPEPATSSRSSSLMVTHPLPRQMPRPRIPHLHLAGGEVLLPPSRHRRRGLLVREELLGVPGLHAGVDEDGGLVGDVVAEEVGAGGVEVRGGLEAGEGGPEEVDGACGGAAGL